MFCQNCGSPIAEGNRFCMNCGAPAAAVNQAIGDTTTVPEGISGQPEIQPKDPYGYIPPKGSIPPPYAPYGAYAPASAKKRMSSKARGLMWGGVGLATALAIAAILVFVVFAGGAGLLSGNTVQTRFVNGRPRICRSVLRFQLGDGAGP